GNYSFYEKEKELRGEMQKRAYQNQQEYIRQQERFIERFRAKATKATQAQSAMKRLDKLDRIDEVDGEAARININFTVEKTPGKILCTLKNIGKKFGDIEILHAAQAEINRGDKIALIGANGKGKSTLLRIVAGTETFTGERLPGHNVVQSFYAQHQLESLHLENEILEELKGAGSGKTEQELRSLLGCFLFSGDDVFKKIKILSGGEKARVALAKTIIGRANFLLLDEPTNHLDINSVQMLIEALNKYQGSFILVSHDRYFVQQTANKIWEIEEEKIREFIGSFDEWERWKEDKLKAESTAKKSNSKRDMPSLESVDKKTEKLSVSGSVEIPPSPVLPVSSVKSNNRETKKELQKVQRTFKNLEEKIAGLQLRKHQLEEELAHPDLFNNKQRFIQFEEEYTTLLKNLEATNKEFELIFDQIIMLEETQTE
ncbi:MAG: ABC-F family ATP-binding cassette domain-containing protein, partial [Chitinophagaceae bacterium]